MNYIPVRVFCPLNKQELTVYCYPFPNGRYVSNGCDELNGSSACKECCIKSAKIAEELATLKDGDFPFNQH